MTIVKFKYKNYKGEARERTVEVTSLDFLRNPGFDYQPGWFLNGICQEKQLVRSFALTNIILDPPEGMSQSLMARIMLK